MKKIILIPIISFILCGCMSANPVFDTPLESEQAVICKTDEFSKNTTCDGANQTTESIGKDANTGSVSYLRMLYTRDKSNKHFVINGHIPCMGWCFPDRAIDKDGTSMDFKRTDGEVMTCMTGSGSCLTYEYFTIKTDRKYIEKHKENGIAIKIYGKNGDSIIELSPVYIQGFLNAINKH